MFAKVTSVLLVVALSGCQTGVVSYQSAVMAEQVMTTDRAVLVTGPSAQISATDCKRVVEDSAPSASLALNRLKSKAAQLGFNSIHSVQVVSSGSAALLSNCWSQITATGIAYNR